MSPRVVEWDIDLPDWADFLADRSGAIRYKGLYGGRGSGKSWTMARALLLLAAETPHRILCLREKQTSLKESVYQLLVDQIGLMKLPGFQVTKDEIRHENGSIFAFKGLWLNEAGLKSFEGVDIAWIEEAHTTSEASWNMLDPTVRKAKSEIWASWNPDLETDAIHQHFVIDPAPGTVAKKVLYSDNPWLDPVLERQAALDRVRNPVLYAWKWGGACRPAVEGAIYERELIAAETEGRIAPVPYVHGAPVHTAWDLGWGDKMAIWCWQRVGLQTRLLRYLEGTQTTVLEFVRELQGLGYVWGKDYLPWDGAKKDVGSGLSVYDRLRSVGRSPIVVPMASVHAGIDAVRTLFPTFAFDAKACVDGVQHLRRYSYDKNQDGTTKRTPKHDDASHAADALRTLAMGVRVPKEDHVVAERPSIAQQFRGVGAFA